MLLGGLSCCFQRATFAGGSSPDGLAAVSQGDASLRTLGFAALVFIVLLVAGLAARAVADRRGPAESSQDPGIGPGEPARAVQGSVLRFFSPVSAERALLPGRFEVIGGDSEVREILFYRPCGQSNPEITFGRVAGAPFSHIQVKAGNVAGLQARMSYLEGRWILTNLARGVDQATRHCDSAMAIDQQVVLGSGDTVEIGPVAFTFRA